MSRRAFISRSAAVVGGGLLSARAVEGLVMRDALGAHHPHGQPYGPLRRVPDQRGVEVLALPAGFSYVTFGHIGSTMSDGNPTPLALDGMSAFAGGRRHGHANGHGHGDALVRLIRNSEDRNPVGTPGGLLGDRSKAYDPAAFGGTTTLVYDERRRELVEDFVSLNGTYVNCAGGRSYRFRSWLTGEEIVAGPEASDPELQFPKRHGYLFETPVDRDRNELEVGEPIVAAGRFAHEAAAVDQRTGIVYETEDPGSGVGGAGFYRYIPKNPWKLTAGGRLQMLAIEGRPRVDLREGQRRGEPLAVTWVDIEEPDPELTEVGDPRSTFNQGWSQGGAKFNRLEGCWYDDGIVFFVSTSGGDAKNGDVNPDGFREGFGQVWAYRPGHDGGILVLVYESPSGAELDGPDNLTVTPRGALLTCEDDASSALKDTHPLAPGITNVNRVIGISRRGEAFEFAVNVLNGSELAGCCFSPSGKTLFFNLFGYARFDEEEVEGMTCAVTGPWRRGPL